jgi:hypothetical protein
MSLCCPHDTDQRHETVVNTVLNLQFQQQKKCSTEIYLLLSSFLRRYLYLQ